VIAYSQDDKDQLDEGKLLLSTIRLPTTAHQQATFPSAAHRCAGQLSTPAARRHAKTTDILRWHVQQADRILRLRNLADGRRGAAVTWQSRGTGPDRLGPQGNETVVIVSVTASQDSPCVSTASAEGTDLQSAVEKAIRELLGTLHPPTHRTIC